jgi:hypothetical protein
MYHTLGPGATLMIQDLMDRRRLDLGRVKGKNGYLCY